MRFPRSRAQADAAPPPPVPVAAPPHTITTAGLGPEPHDTFLHLGRTRAPATLSRLGAAFGLDAAQAESLAVLLDQSAAPRPYRHIDVGGRIRYFGHSCLVLQTPGGAVVTDPFISADGDADDRYDLDDLPDFIDLVLVTHGHRDPIVLETLLQLRGRIGTIVVPRSLRTPETPSTGRYLSRLGFPVVEAADYDEFAFPGGRVVATPFLGERGTPDLRGESTYWVELAGRSAFIGADSSGLDPSPYRCIRRHLGTTDYAFLAVGCDNAPPAWLHHPLLTRGRGTGDTHTHRAPDWSAGQAAAIMTELGAGQVYVHPVGARPRPAHLMSTIHPADPRQVQQIDGFMTWCADHGITAGHLLHQQEWCW
ncbi:MBL fold metallo-hydrolase [Streptomyces sp. NPDC091377]|uniref:MBL fold metallo-hydrolase n=1 Tax=Streptomyces sp. NPDC091377 TaxID=3365995 RepID=UPI003830134F